MRITDPKWNLLGPYATPEAKAVAEDIYIFKLTKEEILKRTGDKLQEPFYEEIRPGFETMQA